MEPDEIVFITHSDDCASIVGRNNVDESALWGRWWPLVVDGYIAGHVMVDYGDGWEFHLRPYPGSEMNVLDNPLLYPELQEEEEWEDD